ncbi:MAG: protoporphyrinogen oxidase, partial [Verrucomicrobiota bacterium]
VLSQAQADLNALLGIQGEPEMVHHRHWSKAIPQYDLGYDQIFKTIDQIETAHPNLYLRGNYKTGISLTNCIESA